MERVRVAHKSAITVKCLSYWCIYHVYWSRGFGSKLLYNRLPYEHEKDKECVVINLMTARCVGAVNTIFERYSFNTRNQQEHESFKDNYSALRGQVEKCEYGEFRDELLRDRIVGGIRSNSVRKVLLSKKDLTLSSAVDICLTSETAMHASSFNDGGMKSEHNTFSLIV